MVGKWCDFVYRQASIITVLSPGFKRLLIERGVRADKIHVIYNWCAELSNDGDGRHDGREQALAGRFNVVFAGTMGEAQALDSVLAAASLVESDLPKVQFVFIGGGVALERLKGEADRRHLGNVIFLPKRPLSEIGAILDAADVLLVHLRKDPLFTVSIPSKIQAYMFAGRPILACVEGDAADLLERAGAGMTCCPEDPEAIAQTVRAMYDMPGAELAAMGDRGRAFYHRELSMANGVSKFEQIFQSVVSG
jgi:glycosyltransferase involved in cell wall biosynthesis